MSANLKNFSPLLRGSRLFPDDDPQALAVQVDRAYIETAYAVNQRTVGVHGVTFPLLNGITFFLEGRTAAVLTFPFDNLRGKRLSGQRQTFEFTTFS